MRRISVGGMSRTPKAAPTVKKVAPPAVPHEFRHSGSSFGSAGYASSEDAVFLAPNDSTAVPRDDHSDYGSTVSGGAGKSPGPVYPAPAFTFPGGGPNTTNTHKATSYYHHQLSLQEDQGIDMTQSPGRDSPGSSSGSAGSGSRHSTASLDSGRASYHPLATNRTAGSAGSPRCSLSSSCSIGSCPSAGGNEQSRAERMLAQGAPDHDVVLAWLADLHLDEYFPLFAAAGYDLPTMVRMTPEDLTAVGIKKPHHRKKLRTEMSQLCVSDPLPDYVPGSLDEWLRLLRLEEYLPALLDQNYRSVDDVTQLTWEDLEDIGIVKLGHQKKIMLAIKRVKDLRAGKRPSIVQHQLQDVIVHHPPPPSPGCPSVHSTFRSFHQPWELDQTRQLAAAAAGGYYQQAPLYFTDIVPIKIRGGRGKSLESLEDPTERNFGGNHEPMQTFYYGTHIGWRPRSYDDGDITPTNECTALAYEGGGTLPRPRGLVRPRPIAKIAATAQPRPAVIADPCEVFKSSPQAGKRLPPSPPRRHTEQVTTAEVHHSQNCSPLPLPAYPSSDSLSISLEAPASLNLPPPPAPATPPQQRVVPSRSWEEQELINALALQHRNGSDASFKSSSSTESDSLPFANENAGTIKTRAAAASAANVSRQTEYATLSKSRQTRPEPADVLNDIGNMLANLTDELDAMLEEEEEKRAQGQDEGQ